MCASGTLAGKFAAFGWEVHEANGHDMDALIELFSDLKASETTQPKVVIAHTIKGKGVQHVQRGGRGDQLVKVSIEVPTNLSKKQKDALQAFESTLEDKNYSRRASFFDKLKDLFK